MKDFAFDKTNFILLGIAALLIIAGFVLMSGSGSTEEAFNPEIFSARRIKVAPLVCFTGFMLMIPAILYHPSTSKDQKA